MTRKTWTLAAAVLGSGIVFLDSTIVSVALPKIGEQLPVTLFGVLEAQSYVYAGYLVTLSALLILAGALTDHYGRRRMFALGLAAFGLTSAVCGLAPNMELLVVFRVLQGAAGAFLVPGSLALITSTFAGEERGRAFGVWAGASAATTIAGPLLGGFLVDTISWRLAFLINIPLVGFALYAVWRHVDETRDEKQGGFDWLGAIVIALAVGGLAFGAVRGEARNWADPLAFVSLAVGAVAAVAFPLLMARGRNPLVPLDLFRSRNFSVTNLSTLVIYGALYVSQTYQGLFLQGTLGYTAFAAGSSGLPITVLLMLFSPRVGKLTARYGPRVFMTVGPALMGAGTLWLARIPATSEPWRAALESPASLLPSRGYVVDVLPAVLLFGIGLTIMVAPLTTALMASVPVRRSGLASAINNAISRVGAPLVTAVIFIAISTSFYATLATRVPGLDPQSDSVRREITPLNRPARSASPDIVAAARDASTDAFHLAMLVSAGLLFTGAAINLVGIRPQPPFEEERQAEPASSRSRAPEATTAA